MDVAVNTKLGSGRALPDLHRGVGKLQRLDAHEHVGAIGLDELHGATGALAQAVARQYTRISHLVVAGSAHYPVIPGSAADTVIAAIGQDQVVAAFASQAFSYVIASEQAQHAIQRRQRHKPRLDASG